MKRYRVQVSELAEASLYDIWQFIARESGTDRADRMIASIRTACDELGVAPLRGMVRKELRPDLRVIGAVRGRVSLLFRVGEEAVTILDIRYAGWDHAPLG